MGLLEELKSNEEGFVNQLEQELAETQACAKEAARKEQTYTYRMWGNFISEWFLWCFYKIKLMNQEDLERQMWRRIFLGHDAYFARSIKEDLERQAEILKHKIAKCKDDKVENIHEEMESTY